MEANGGLVFIDQDSGVFTALDGKSSKHLSRLGANESCWASPKTHMVAGKQCVSIAGPAGFLTFALLK